jgi:hypothetical protein
MIGVSNSGERFGTARNLRCSKKPTRKKWNVRALAMLQQVEAQESSLLPRNFMPSSSNVHHLCNAPKKSTLMTYMIEKPFSFDVERRKQS